MLIFGTSIFPMFTYGTVRYIYIIIIMYNNNIVIIIILIIYNNISYDVNK